MNIKIFHLIIIIAVILILISLHNNTTIEGYYGLTPYKYHWNIFKCLTSDCLIKESYKCNRWCDKWAEPGGRANCRVRCLDYADQQADSIKHNNYTWFWALPLLNKYAIHTTHKKGPDYVRM